VFFHFIQFIIHIADNVLFVLPVLYVSLFLNLYVVVNPEHQPADLILPALVDTAQLPVNRIDRLLSLSNTHFA
jgi:hypothetical protein